ncbi:MAG: asparagine synthase (glutamine-hydrolyzing) [Legionellaceae bacterium]|nr:asparagine synthase (glutamine-hydrolyzing) [Legionellaceae bacterium]
MCGLVGFFNTNQTIKTPIAIISNMTDRLAHRGPDDSGLWADPHHGIAFGHRRLAIMDLSLSGHQPMTSHHDRYVIVYNGEIYNARELKKQLEQKNHRFIGHSDTEVILTLIEEDGLESALKQLSGMFAFALWDKQEKILQLIRDRMGEKPLYYGLVDKTLVFASELKAIKAFPNFQNNIAPASVSALMQYGYIPAPQSIYEHIYKLLPGTYVTFADSLTLPSPQIYWSASHIAEQSIHSPLQLNDREAITQLDIKLNNIIRRQMISDVPTGAFLSGGIDSSVIAALMQANSNQPVKTFTIGFKEKDYNEAEYAKAIAKHLKTDHTELYVDAQEALSVIPKLPKIYDEPFADSSAIPTYLVSKLTRQHVTVSLSGDGGDELFGGYNRYLWSQAIWKKMALVPYPMRFTLQKLLLSLSSPRIAPLMQLTKLPMTTNKLDKLASLLTARSPAEVYQQLITQWHNPHELIAIHSIQENLLLQIGTMNFIENMMVTDTISYLPDDIMVKVDRAGMAVGLENRAPFLDHELFEFMWKLPLDMKIRNKTTKWLLREVLSTYVPPPLFDRPKMGFGIPLDMWLRGPLRDWAENLLNKNTLTQQGFLNPDPILKKWHEHLSGKKNWQYQLWPVLMFQAWMET